MIETVGLGAGSYPDAPEPKEEKTVVLKCICDAYIRVPIDWEYDKIKEYAESLSFDDLLSETDMIKVDDIEM